MSRIRTVTLSFVAVAAAACGRAPDVGSTAAALTAPGDFFVRADRCVGPDGNHATAGAAIELQSCSGGDAQRIDVQTHPSGGKRLVIGGNMCIEVAGSAQSGAGLRVAACSTAAAQQFTVEDRGGGVRRIHTGNGAWCVDVPHNNAESNQALQLYSCNDSDAQKLEPFDDAVSRQMVANDYRCVPGSNGNCARFAVLTRGSDSQLRSGSNCLDVSHADYSDGNPVIQYACNGQANQKFRVDTSGTAAAFVSAGNSAYCVVPGPYGNPVVTHCNGGAAQSWRAMYSVQQLQLVLAGGGNSCLGAQNAGATVGTRMAARECGSEAAQAFIGYTTPDRYTELRSQELCLDVAGGVFQPGVAVRLWSCNHTAAQRFQLDAVTPERQYLETADASYCVQAPSGSNLATVQLCKGAGAGFFPVQTAVSRKLFAGDGLCLGDSIHAIACSDVLPLLHIDRREGWHEVRASSLCLGGRASLSSGAIAGWDDCGKPGTQLERHAQPVGFDLRIASNDGLCIDIPHNDATNSIQLYSCNDTEAQRWYDADRVTNPPPPPPDPGPFTVTTWLQRQQIISGNIPYVGSFSSWGQTSIISKINFPTNWPQVWLVKPGHTTEECGSDAGSVLVWGDMTADQEMAVWGTSNLTLLPGADLNFVGCVVDDGVLRDSVPVNITYTRQ